MCSVVVKILSGSAMYSLCVDVMELGITYTRGAGCSPYLADVQVSSCGVRMHSWKNEIAADDAGKDSNLSGTNAGAEVGQ